MTKGLHSPQGGQAGATGSALTSLGSVETRKGRDTMTGRINTNAITHLLTIIPEGTIVVIVHLDVDMAHVELDGDVYQVEPEAVDGPTLHVIHEEVAR